MLVNNVCVRRPPSMYATYAMAAHKPSEPNPNREALLFESVKRMNTDGLSNIKSLGVKILNVEYFALFTHLNIHVGSSQKEGLV